MLKNYLKISQIPGTTKLFLHLDALSACLEDFYNRTIPKKDVKFEVFLKRVYVKELESNRILLHCTNNRARSSCIYDLKTRALIADSNSKTQSLGNFKNILLDKVTLSPFITENKENYFFMEQEKARVNIYMLSKKDLQLRLLAKICYVSKHSAPRAFYASNDKLHIFINKKFSDGKVYKLLNEKRKVTKVNDLGVNLEKKNNGYITEEMTIDNLYSKIPTVKSTFTDISTRKHVRISSNNNNEGIIYFDVMKKQFKTFNINTGQFKDNFVVIKNLIDGSKFQALKDYKHILFATQISPHKAIMRCVTKASEYEPYKLNLYVYDSKSKESNGSMTCIYSIELGHKERFEKILRYLEDSNYKSELDSAINNMDMYVEKIMLDDENIDYSSDYLKEKFKMAKTLELIMRSNCIYEMNNGDILFKDFTFSILTNYLNKQKQRKKSVQSKDFINDLGVEGDYKNSFSKLNSEKDLDISSDEESDVESDSDCFEDAFTYTFGKPSYCAKNHTMAVIFRKMSNGRYIPTLTDLKGKAKQISCTSTIDFERDKRLGFVFNFGNKDFLFSSDLCLLGNNSKNEGCSGDFYSFKLAYLKNDSDNNDTSCDVCSSSDNDSDSDSDNNNDCSNFRRRRGHIRIKNTMSDDSDSSDEDSDNNDCSNFRRRRRHIRIKNTMSDDSDSSDNDSDNNDCSNFRRRRRHIRIKNTMSDDSDSSDEYSSSE